MGWQDLILTLAGIRPCSLDPPPLDEVLIPPLGCQGFPPLFGMLFHVVPNAKEGIACVQLGGRQKGLEVLQ